jgi:hypothetical protein
MTTTTGGRVIKVFLLLEEFGIGMESVAEKWGFDNLFYEW